MWHIIYKNKLVSRDFLLTSDSFKFLIFMRSFTQKLITCVLLVMFSGNMAVAALGTGITCATQSCCCCGGTEISPYEPPQERYSTAYGCCSSAANTPCNLNKNYRSDVQEPTIPNVRNNSENSNGNIALVSGEMPFIEIFREHLTTNHFWMADHPTPIYLQNQTFIC